MTQYVLKLDHHKVSCAERPQIAVKEAIPFTEFGQNPFAVLLTTTMGGHLSWFESGGGRWFAKPVCQNMHVIWVWVKLTINLGKPIPHEVGPRHQH